MMRTRERAVSQVHDGHLRCAGSNDPASSDDFGSPIAARLLRAIEADRDPVSQWPDSSHRRYTTRQDWDREGTTDREPRAACFHRGDRQSSTIIPLPTQPYHLVERVVALPTCLGARIAVARRSCRLDHKQRGEHRFVPDCEDSR
jgi:hypothetical protein